MEYTLLLIRHGKTEGNLRRAYIGSTDQPLCEKGRMELKQSIERRFYPPVEYVFLSPMLRCLETRELIYGSLPYGVIPELKEIDFGCWEERTYEELDGNADYQNWIDQGGRGNIPGGEDPDSFRKRCYSGFEKVIDEVLKRQLTTSALIVHGGTIMTILEKYAPVLEETDFFAWQVKSGEGYRLTIDSQLWIQSQKIKRLSKLPNTGTQKQKEKEIKRKTITKRK